MLKPDAPRFTLEELKTFLKRRLGKLSKKELYDEEERKRNMA